MAGRRASSMIIAALAGSLACGADRASSSDGEDGSSSSAESSSSSTTTGENTGFTSAPDLELPWGDGDHDQPPACNPEAFALAPAPVEIDGLSAVPIDILELDALLSFELATATTSAAATLRFALGETGGMPFFDLRQTPDTLLLDGRPIDGSLLVRHDFGVGWDYGFLILELELEPCTVHQLELGYPVSTPQARLAEGPKFSQEPARVRFDLLASDLDPGRFLESWLPANMPWDRHPISLTVRLEDAEANHTLISNASVDELGPHQWQLEFPATTTALDPMIVVLPSD
ncbi:MAG TPA: hypothetical protein VK034_18815, partial [Enhygromyxa sp.]|nr:hypothetical protein [Enhygromyxa sp.]